VTDASDNRQDDSVWSRSLKPSGWSIRDALEKLGEGRGVRAEIGGGRKINIKLDFMGCEPLDAGTARPDPVLFRQPGRD
jgi:hypothetical protein